MKQATLLISAVLISSCATLFACKAGFRIDVYGFDLANARLYHGRKEDPDKVQALDSTFNEREWVALRFEDWQEVRRYCQVPK